jgi:hypothetical protein
MSSQDLVRPHDICRPWPFWISSIRYPHSLRLHSLFHWPPTSSLMKSTFLEQQRDIPVYLRGLSQDSYLVIRNVLEVWIGLWSHPKVKWTAKIRLFSLKSLFDMWVIFDIAGEELTFRIAFARACRRWKCWWWTPPGKYCPPFSPRYLYTARTGHLFQRMLSSWYWCWFHRRAEEEREQISHNERASRLMTGLTSIQAYVYFRTHTGRWTKFYRFIVRLRVSSSLFSFVVNPISGLVALVGIPLSCIGRFVKII